MSARLLKNKRLFVVNTAIALGLTGPFANSSNVTPPKQPVGSSVSFVPTDRNGDPRVPLRQGARNFDHKSGTYISLK
jgi:hypothetical protein